MLKVENWPIEKLIPYARNPRKNDEQVDRMASAIKDLGIMPQVSKKAASYCKNLKNSNSSNRLTGSFKYIGSKET